MHAELQLDNQICFRLYTAARLITQAYTPMLNELGITYPQYLVLMVLWEQDSQPVNDIAHRLLLETNTVTPLLQRMEKLGIVVRKRGKEDKRQQIVSLTKKGRDMEEEAKVTKQVRNLAYISAEITNSKGELCNEGEAIYFLMNEEKAKEMGFLHCEVED